MAGISRPFFVAIAKPGGDLTKKAKNRSACLPAVVKKPASVSKSVRPARHDIERR
jgi:hypothetical protein